MAEFATRRLITPVGVAAVVLGLLVLVPRVAGTTWASVGAILEHVSPAALAVMAGIWVAGLWFHSFALAAALPGLTKRRALTLSLTGSAVANVLPLGGAAGIGLNFAMVRRWGLSAQSFAAFTAVTNLVDVLAKLAVTAVATVLVIAAGDTLSLPPGAGRLIGAALLVVSPLLGAILASDRIAGRTGAAADRLIVWLTRSRIRSTLAASLPELRGMTVRILRTRWRPLGGGMACYLTSQGFLLWWCFYALHVDAGPLIVLAGLAVDRFLTMIPVTPGGAGVVEAGSIAALVALGGPPVIVVAAVLLYRSFTFLAEIPVGGIGIGMWLLRHRGTAPAVEALR
jgi:putative heme transporter